MGEESVKLIKPHTQKFGYYKGVHMHTSGMRIEKSVIRYVRTKWMTPNKCCGIFLVHWSGQVHRASSPARKMSLFSSIIITTSRSLKLRGW